MGIDFFGGGSSNVFSLVKISDTDASNYLTIDWNENDTSDRTLYFLVGGGDRSITLSGNPTLGDWFDQSVKAASTPTLAGLTLTGFSGVVKATAGVLSGGAGKADIGLTNVEDTALSTWAGTANITTLGTIATGTWSATAITNVKGGTGQDSSGWTGYPYVTSGTWAADTAITKLNGTIVVTMLADNAVAGYGALTINSSANTELTDTDGRQAWLYVEPKINQSGTAAYDGIYLNVTETAKGNGTTGDGNNLLNLSVSSVPRLRVDTAGGLHLYDDVNTATYSTILQTNAEGITSASDLRIGVDESTRTLIICDRLDIATDFGLTAAATPTIMLATAGAATGLKITAEGGVTSTAHVTITAASAGYAVTLNGNGGGGVSLYAGTTSDFYFTADNDTADAHVFGVNYTAAAYNKRLTDSDGRQSILRIYQGVNQSGTAAFDGIYLNAILDGLGSGATGDGNNLLNLSVSAVVKNRIDIYGHMHGGESSSLEDHGVLTTNIADTWCGTIFVNTSDNYAGIWRIEATALTTVSANAAFTNTKDTDAKWNLYIESNVVKLQNEIGTTQTAKVLFIGY